MGYIVALTGGIGSGKSTVADAFSRLGVTIIDADIIARQVVEPGTPALYAIAEHFGHDMIAPDGTLNRRMLRERIFSHPDPAGDAEADVAGDLTLCPLGCTASGGK